MFGIIEAGTAAILLVVLGGIRLRRGRSAIWSLPAFLVSGILIGLEQALLTMPELADRLLHPIIIMHALLCPAWLLFSYSYVREFSLSSLKGRSGVFFYGSFIPLIVAVLNKPDAFFYSPDFRFDQALFLEPLSFFFYLQILLFFFIAIGNIEVSLASAEHGVRWKVKYALLGAGTIIAVHVLFYSQALITRMINMDYLTLKSFGVIIGCVLFYYSEAVRNGSGVMLSGRKMARSAVSILAGVYLLGLGVVLEGYRYFGATFSKYALISLLFCVALGGAIMLFSDRIRRKLRLQMYTLFFKEKYDYRKQWMELTRNMSTARNTSELLHIVLVHMCETFGFAGAGFLPADRTDPCTLRTGVFHELPLFADVPRDDSKALFAMGGEALPLASLEGRVSPETYERLVLAEISMVLPVHAGTEPEGLLLFGRGIDFNEEHGPEDFQLLAVEAQQVGLTVRSFRHGEELAVAREMEAMGRVAALILHDLKNQVYPLSLMLGNAQEFMDNKEFQDDLLRTLRNTVNNMMKLIRQLTEVPDRSSLSREPVELAALAESVAALVPQATVVVRGGPEEVLGDKEQLEKVILNLFTNAIEAGGEPYIDVEVGRDGLSRFIKVSDRGGGIDETILREGLFTPFRTSKKRGMGIGLYHCRKIMDAHNGKVLVENKAGVGATFTLSFGSVPGQN
ncbi:PEP-CTERM system histidine kinase PrsK [Desulfovibrio mangrovi]|uniref:XrtA/PEP-CTERM system histidine kinase PrsK n=1 Tax=Desulfovibrio mangrovi TaxID=2976983 RepID=UPI0022467E6A|nr:XrtA/PEP-CTERM system histidine kinase PrsK [Desulfovibrio mangrovi]UZP67550.1 PEP-CTERM system histidine kinase PrsK [Desulfovibrio mangrovi]